MVAGCRAEVGFMVALPREARTGALALTRLAYCILPHTQDETLKGKLTIVELGSGTGNEGAETTAEGRLGTEMAVLEDLEALLKRGTQGSKHQEVCFVYQHVN